MNNQIYYILLLEEVKDPLSKWVFPLKEGDNIIGSDASLDISLKLKKEEYIPNLHVKIIIEDDYIGIKPLDEPMIYKSKPTNKEPYNLIGLKNLREYNIIKNTTYFLNTSIKITVYYGTIKQIQNFLYKKNCQEEYEKWYTNQVLYGDIYYFRDQINNYKISRSESMENSIIENNENLFKNDKIIIKSIDLKEENDYTNLRINLNKKKNKRIKKINDDLEKYKNIDLQHAINNTIEIIKKNSKDSDCLKKQEDFINTSNKIREKLFETDSIISTFKNNILFTNNIKEVNNLMDNIIKNIK